MTENCPHTLLRDDALVLRIVRLTFDVELWPVLAPLLPPLPHVEELELVLDSGDLTTSFAGCATLTCCNLRTLGLQTSSSLQVAADVVVRFARSSLTDVSLPRRLRVAGCRRGCDLWGASIRCTTQCDAHRPVLPSLHDLLPDPITVFCHVSRCALRSSSSRNPDPALRRRTSVAAQNL